MKTQKEKVKYANVGGQAVMEGIMMRGPKRSVLVVRKPDGEMAVEEMQHESIRDKYAFFRWPIVRGCVSFVESMIIGYKAISRSAVLSGLEEETNGNKAAQGAILAFSLILGVLLAVGLFMFLPAGIVWLLTNTFGLELGFFKALIEGVVRILIFLGYIALISLMKDIKRLFQYHGAEHKTIFCLEANEELTVENVKKQKRFHPRCGTSFIFLVLIISIIFSSFITWDSLIIRILLKLACLPVIAGLSFELIRYAGRHDNLFTRIVSAPGKALQRLTTKEPEDDMIEVAIRAIHESIKNDEGIEDMSCIFTR